MSTQSSGKRRLILDLRFVKMAAFESKEVINMDEEIEKRKEDNILQSGLRAWLKEINLLEY